MNESTEKPPEAKAKTSAELEASVLKYWEENQVFKKSLEQTKDGQPYVFYDGPPFATGTPHYGSILPSVLKDVFPRYHTMNGKNTRRRWGWDCHGLPIENIVEKQLGISGKKDIENYGVDRFNQACREGVLKYADDWKDTVARVARWVDFDNSYKTMDTSYMESVWWTLRSLWDKKLIYEDRKVLMYCSRCETPISNFEVAMDNSYKEVTDNSVIVKFHLLPRQILADNIIDNSVFVLAWTTTPWTLPANTALNVGNHITYVQIQVQSGEHYILAEDRLSVIKEPFALVNKFSARSLEGLAYEPLFPGVITADGKSFRIYGEDYVTTTDGTGVVHNAAMYGEDDYNSAKRHGLPREHILDSKGHFLGITPPFLQGKFFKNADRSILENLGARNSVYEIIPYTHSYPHCHRCATPLYYNALSAWFINIQIAKNFLVEQNNSVNWYPSHLKHGRFQKGIEGAPDWNISRNRFWATPLPFWKCQNEGCKYIHCFGSVAELAAHSTNFQDVYPNYKGKLTTEDDEKVTVDLHRPYIDQLKVFCPQCKHQSIRVPEVVDCWVESGSMPFAELHFPFENQELFKQRFPSDFVVEYLPQTRAWFYVSHVISSILFGRSPFKNVLTTGTILAEDGAKMSKSKGNYPDPSIILDKYGADALRFYLCASPVVKGEDINFSELGVAEVARKVNTLLLNSLSFYQLYSKEQINLDNVPAPTHALDKWMLSRLSSLETEVTRLLDSYDTAPACKLLVQFIDDLSTWYIRRSRDRFKSGTSPEGLKVFGFVLTRLSLVLAPFMPFLAEHIYRTLTSKTSVHLETWKKGEGLVADKNLEISMETVREVVSLGLNIRKQENSPVRQPLESLAYKLKLETVLDSDLEKIILEELNVRQVNQQLLGLSLPDLKFVAGEGVVSTVVLDFALTDDLKKEGLARELERAVQDVRKKAGLQIGQEVDLYYNTNSEELESILVSSLDRKKTYLRSINKDPEVDVDYEAQLNVGNGAIWIGIVL